MAMVAIERREFWAVITLAAFSTIAMLEATRVFVSYLVFVVDQSRRVEIASAVMAVFLLPALTPLLTRALRVRNSVIAAAVALAALRLVMQFIDTPLVRLVSGGAVVVCWGALMIVLLASRRSLAGYGAMLGMAFDASLRIVLRDVDLPWMAHFWKDLLTIVLAALIAATALTVPRSLAAREGSWGGALPVLALGPGIALYHLVIGNPGIAQVRAGLGYLDAARALALGLYAGVALPWLWLMRTDPARSRVNLALIASIFLASAASLLVWIGGAWHGPTVLAGAVVALGALATLLLIGVAIGRGSPGERASVTRTTLWLTVGMVLQFVVLFIYYSGSGLLLMIAVAWALVAGCAVYALVGTPAVRANIPGRRLFFGIVLAGMAVHIVAVQLTIASTGALGDGQPVPATFTVMTYNIQSGFALDNDWDLEAQARVIEAHDPDIVVLQEVSRGWLVTTGSDDLLWLSRRLDMEYVWGPASDDGLWGNAILSRAPLSDGETEQFTTTQNLKRSVVMAQVATEAGPIWVIGTHLDNPTGAGTVRSAQISELLSFWGGRSPAVILGDFNAVPNDPAILTMREAGFTDVGGAVDPAQTTSEDGRRIDYIFATSEFSVDSVNVPAVDASDHRPVVATITLNP